MTPNAATLTLDELKACLDIRLLLLIQQRVSVEQIQFLQRVWREAPEWYDSVEGHVVAAFEVWQKDMSRPKMRRRRGDS